MKKGKKLKVITLILVIILITILSFLGVYNIFRVNSENLVKDYTVGMELKGRNMIRLKVDDTVNEVYYDSEGKKVDQKEEGVNYTTSQEPVNKPENLTKDNYKKAKEIVEDRLKFMDAEEYKIRFNEETGTIELEFIDDELSDYLIEAVINPGDFRIIDDETEEVLMDKSLIKRARVAYNTDDTAYTSVYVDIEFSKEGTQKLEELSRIYVETTEQVVNDEGEIENKTVEKKIAVMIDDNELVSTHFGEPLTNGHMYLPVGRATKDNSDLRRYALQASMYAALIESQTTPVVYAVEGSNFIVTNINKTIIPMVSIVALVIEAIVLVVMFKARGIIASVLQIGYTALLLLLLKYTNVTITLEGLFALVIMSIVNAVFIGKVLFDFKNDGNILKSINENLIKFINISIPVLIVAIVFCFVKWLEINSFGMVIFWGYVVSLLYNVIFTKGILKDILDK